MQHPERDAVALQQHDPRAFPVLLSTGRSGSGRVEHLLFEALDAPSAHYSVESARAALAALPWRSQSGSTARVQVGDVGWCVFLSFEYAAAIYPRQLPRPDADFPLCYLQRVRVAAISDAPTTGATATDLQPIPATAWIEDDPALYLRGVERVQRYIQAGDIYQANLTRRWRVACAEGQGEALYRRLLQFNSAPFAARWVTPEFEILSSSPERLFEVRGLQIRTQPIAGSRPRSAQSQRDQALASELLGHPKERAEHIMLVDLERNDLGRICQTGSVQVPRVLAVESYPTVQHLVSDVCGTLRENLSLADIVDATFPGGTISGCPKVRCLQILTDIEARPRRAYTGSLGYCLDRGPADFNILIRTLLWRQGQLQLDAGAGIVADSDAAAELAETGIKAQGLIRALAVQDVAA